MVMLWFFLKIEIICGIKIHITLIGTYFTWNIFPSEYD